MTDKERILMTIITRVIPGLTYCCHSYEDREKYVKSYMLNRNGLEKGDLVFANTSIKMNDFVVGFIEDFKPECTVIRELGSNRLCNYYNESFSVINKDKLGYEILEGIQYKIYQKVLKAFSDYSSYSARFHSIEFNNKICTVKSRKMFSNEPTHEFSFKYNSKTTIKEIGKLLEEKENK
ncbi:hypothetical protein [Konateibacter massiliensis]|uniref:hypothetical protein n=1 Tax=Konateibacter massiliensis TaxID=2002841 RepID=UPI000C15DBE0|nr:hypothetical protein [Konateibacter massiliensis]